MLTNSLPHPHDEGGILDNGVPGEDRSVICDLVKHYLKMSYLLGLLCEVEMDSSSLMRPRRVGFFFTPRSAIPKETAEVRIDR